MRFRDVLELKQLLEEAEKKAKDKEKGKEVMAGGSFANTFAILMILFPFLGPASLYGWAWAFAESAKMLHTIWP